MLIRTVSVYVLKDAETGEVSVEEYDDSLAEKGTTTYIAPSFRPSTFNVIGKTDERIEIRDPAIVFLDLSYPNGYRTGSGVFVSGDTIITAGHNLYNPSLGGWVTSVSIKPGGINSPYQTYYASTYCTTSGWVSSGDPGEDYGFITTAVNIAPATYGMAVVSDQSIINEAYILAKGHSGDLGYGKIWQSVGKLNPHLMNSRQFAHTADTYGGTSGGAVTMMNIDSVLIGINTIGDYNANYARRVTSDLIDFFLFINSR